jgi:transposase-like protein
MVTKSDRGSAVKRDGVVEKSEVVRDRIEELAREGAREMLMHALSEEVDGYLGRGRYERNGDYRGYRNGSMPRKLTLGSGTVDLAMTRIRDVPAGQEPFESKILRKYQRRSDTIDETFMNLFVEGLATRDFEPALRLLVGEDAPLSPSTISRLSKQFKEQYEAFDRQDLSAHTFVYI